MYSKGTQHAYLNEMASPTSDETLAASVIQEKASSIDITQSTFSKENVIELSRKNSWLLPSVANNLSRKLFSTKQLNNIQSNMNISIN